MLGSLPFSVLVGTVLGFLSALGIGGGSLLMVWMTAVLAMEQKAAQGINLLYFLPTAVCALIFHAKHRQICWKAVVPAALAGCAAAVPGALLAASLEMELLRKIPQGDYTVEPRTMLDVSVVSGKQTLFHETALNDAVVTKGAIARVVQVSVYCDNVEATSFSGDGVIISTPTGSTAYSMSAGGPIVEPSARNLLITPICAHAMLTKTIVVSPERVISVRIGKIGRHNAYLSVDGGRAFRLNTGDVITTKTAQKTTKLVRLKQTSFFEILNKKFIDRQR